MDEELPAECVFKHKTTIEDIAKAMGNSFETLEIKDETLDYLKLINFRNFANRWDMVFLLKYDVNSPSVYNPVDGMVSLPYDQIAGLFDYPFEMFARDYIGVTYQTEYDIAEAQKEAAGGGGKTDWSCEGQRIGCYWAWEGVYAKEFFQARMKRPAIIFNYDETILTEEYKYVHDRIHNKYNGPREILAKGAELLADVREGKPAEFVFDLDKKPMAMYPLSVRHKNIQADIDKLFLEDTESFYLKAPDWTSYLDNK